ncbi:MAG: nucleotidyltransferase family protein [Acutalibacter sp.]|jgi:predicted nucleotidyltransferase
MQEKLKISAVICELNPLHTGHRALFSHAKSHFDGLVCLLSGNYVQRGEPAILDKWARTRLALLSGADLVVELPLPWALAGAERFAAGGVALANALGCVDTLLFGGETSQISLLWQLAKVLNSPDFSALLRQQEEGLPFALQRQRAVAQLVGDSTASLLERPNCILGVEYLKAILAQDAHLSAQVFPRLGAGHDLPETSGPLLSASQARQLLREGRELTGLLPEETLSLWRELAAQGQCPASLERLEPAVLSRLRTMTPEDFAALPDISEGLEFRLYKAARQACSLEEFYRLVKSKRYSHARVRRLAMAAFLGLTKNLPNLPPYLRVLGMTTTGAAILKQAVPSLPLALRPADFQRLGGEALDLFQLEARADDLYALALPTPQPCGRDYTEKLIKLP